jgi:hypothetical protein
LLDGLSREKSGQSVAENISTAAADAGDNHDDPAPKAKDNGFSAFAALNADNGNTNEAEEEDFGGLMVRAIIFPPEYIIYFTISRLSKRPRRAKKTRRKLNTIPSMSHYTVRMVWPPRSRRLQILRRLQWR